MAKKLENRRVAILVTNGVEQVELERPMQALKEAGANVEIVSPESESIMAWQHDHWGDNFDVDTPLEEADSGDYDSLVLPGGVMNPDHLRQDTQAVEFVRQFFQQHKPVASICHGPWMLAEASVLTGRKLTSYPSIKTDLENAGANWVDQEVVVDEGLVTSRSPDDLDAFCAKMIEEFCEGKHEGQTTHVGQNPPVYRESDDSGPRARP